MSVTISQNLPVPPGLVDGSIASAGQITPLYSSLNGLVMPNSILLGILVPSLVDDALTTLTIGMTVTKDWNFITSSVPQLKSLWFLLPFSWSGASGTFHFTYRMNGNNITASPALSANAAGNGLVVGFVGARDSDVPRSQLFLQLDDGGTFATVPANADLPLTISSFGVTVGTASAGSVKFKHVRFWSEG